ncbi:hypothetical protein [Desulfamplus magnetovallimortis]|nr:hypothetical protein [Desulfamplus magnetovallimortis]
MIEDGDPLPVARHFIEHADEIDPDSGDVFAFVEIASQAMAA